MGYASIPECMFARTDHTSCHACTRVPHSIGSIHYLVLQATPETQGAAAVALAHCYCQPAFAVPLFSDPERLRRTMMNWERVADLATDAVPRVVHGGLIAVNHVVSAYSVARSARESEQTGELQTVLALMAWAGAVRVRVAGAHVLFRMDAMPASLKVWVQSSTHGRNHSR